MLSGVSSYQPTKVFGEEPNWKPPSSTFHPISRNHLPAKPLKMVVHTETHTVVLTCHSLLRSLPSGFCSRHTLKPCQGDDWLQMAKPNEPFQVISSWTSQQYSRLLTMSSSSQPSSLRCLTPHLPNFLPVPRTVLVLSALYTIQRLNVKVPIAQSLSSAFPSGFPKGTKITA